MSDTRSTIERKRGSCRSLVTIAATTEEVTKAQTAALEKLGKDIEIPGFRPGKAPAEMLKTKIKEDVLLEETVRLLLPSVLPVILSEHKLQPVIPPRIGITSREPITLQFTIVEKPAVAVAAKKIKIDKKDIALDQQEIEEVIKTISEDHRKTQEVERAAAMGDQVTMDFRGEDSDKKQIPGLQATGEVVMLGKNSLIPGFEQHLVGVKKGESKSFTVAMPKELPVESLRGKPVTFHVTLQKIEEVILPPFDDAFAKDVLKLESAAKAREKIEESVKERERMRESQRREALLLDQIRDHTEMELPDELVHEEKRQLLDEMQERLKRQNMTLKDWVEKLGKSVEEMDKDLTKAAQGRIKLRFGLEKLLEDKKIEATEDEMKAAVDAFVRQLPPDQRKSANVEKDSSAYAQLMWQKRVEKLFGELLK